MKITVLKLKPGVSFVQFGRTWGGNLRFTDDPTPGAPGSVVKNVVATARPDISGVLLVTTLLNKHSGKPYNPYVIPFESIDGFEVDADSINDIDKLAEAVAGLVGAKVGPADPVEAPTEPAERKKPGPKPRVAGTLALILALVGAPSYASDASSEPHPLKNIVCYDAPAPGCLTCIHTSTKDFEVVCGLPKKAKKGGKK